jgi:hypothetical protein
MPAQFNLSADILNATTALPAGLVDSIEFRDQNGNIIANKRVDMGTTETRNIAVRIPQIPASFASQSFTLKVSATAGDLVGTFSRIFTVGAPVPPADPTIQVQQTGSLVLDGNGNSDSDPTHGLLDGATIHLKAGFQMIVMSNLTLTSGGNYDLTIQPPPGSPLSGWAPALVSTPAMVPGPVTTKLVKFGVKPTAGASPTGKLIFRIKRQGAAIDWFQEFDLHLLP